MLRRDSFSIEIKRIGGGIRYLRSGLLHLTTSKHTHREELGRQVLGLLASR